MLLKIPEEIKSRLQLYRAALKGDWEKARSILEADPGAIRDSITEASETIIHIACSTKHITFVKKVVLMLSTRDLEQKNQEGYTALCFAAQLGIVAIAKVIVQRNGILPMIRSWEDRTPLHIAALLGRREMVSYLFSVTNFEALAPHERTEILVATITYDMYGMPHISRITRFTHLNKKCH